MQNDTLYNKVMKKIFIIEITSETPEGELTPGFAITYFNMKPDEVLAAGNLPLIGFCVWKDKDNSYTGYIGVSSFYTADDGSAASIFLMDGPQIDADLTNNVWKIHEE